MEKLVLFFSRCMQSIDNNTLLLSLSASVCYTAANRCAMRASVELFLSLILACFPLIFQKKIVRECFVEC